MGKKLKKNTVNNNKDSNQNSNDKHQTNLSEFYLQEFEKSLASMLESLNNKKIEILKTCTFNSKNDPATRIGKISARCIINDDENIEALQKSILDAAKVDSNTTVKIVSVKSTASSDSTNSASSQEEYNDKHTYSLPVKPTHMNLSSKTSKKLGSLNFSDLDLRDSLKLKKARTPSDTTSERKIYYRHSVTPPQRTSKNLEFKKSFTDSKDKRKSKRTQEESPEEFSSTSPRIKQIESILNSYEELIDFKPNIIYKANKFFVADELSLETILYKIYFEGYSYDDLKEYMFPALRKVNNADSFFDIIFNAVKGYCLKIKEHLLDKLDDIIVKRERLIQTRDGKIEFINEFAGYKKFNKHATTYTTIIKKLYELYKSLEIISGEIEKISSLYLETFLERNKCIKFNCLELHKKLFIKYVYDEPLIKHFFFGITRYFEEKHFYATKYPTAASQLIELNEIFNRSYPSQKIQFHERDAINLLTNFHNFAEYGNDNDDEYFTDDGFEEEEISIKITSSKIKDMKNGQNTNNESNSKKKKKKKKNKSENNINNTENTDINKENENRLTEESLKKKGVSKMDPELEEFEKKLQVDLDPTQEKIKPNISQEWVHNLRQKNPKT